MADAGYDPRDLANMFQTIASQGGGRGPEFLSSHPDPGNRYQKINQEAGYLNVSRDPVKLMRELIEQLEKEPIPLAFEYDGKKFTGEATPIPQTCFEGSCAELDISLNDRHIGIIKRMKNNWKIDNAEDQKMVDAIGAVLDEWFGG